MEFGLATELEGSTLPPIHLPPEFVLDKELERVFPDLLELNRKESQLAMASGMKVNLFPHQKLMYRVAVECNRVVGVASRRSGKTFFFLHLMADAALRFRGDDPKYNRVLPDGTVIERDVEAFPGRFIYIMPTMKQAQEVAWPVLQAIARKVGARAASALPRPLKR